MKQLTLGFGLFLVLIVILADTGSLGRLAFIYTVPYADKVGHFLLYGIFSLLLNLTLLGALPDRYRRRGLLLSGLALCLVIGLEELSQQSFANRTFSLADLAASYLGVICFAGVASKIKSPAGVDDSSRAVLNVRRR